MIMNVLLYSLLTYLVASIPFSVWIGQFVLGRNIRDYGDGNPGATNVRRAGGSLFWYLLAVILDAFKGLLPAGIAYWLLGWSDWKIVPIASAAVLGHIFSVFLRFHGGKAVAVTIGTWVGLLAFEGLLVLPLMLTYWFKTIRESEWAVILMMLALLAYLLLTRSAQTPLFAVWLIHFLLLIYRHRTGLSRLPTLRRAASSPE